MTEVAFCWNCKRWFELSESELNTKNWACPFCGVCNCESCTRAVYGSWR